MSGPPVQNASPGRKIRFRVKQPRPVDAEHSDQKNAQAVAWRSRHPQADRQAEHRRHLQTCRIAAKKKLEYGQFLAMIESDLPFGARTAQMLMTVAADRRLAECEPGSAFA